MAETNVEIAVPVRPRLVRRIVSRRTRRSYRDAVATYDAARQEAVWMAFWGLMHQSMRRSLPPGRTTGGDGS